MKDDSVILKEALDLLIPKMMPFSCWTIKINKDLCISP